MHRPTCGIVTILLLLAWGACAYFGGSELWSGAFLRVGILTAALWLALPQLQRLPSKLLVLVGAALVVVAVVILIKRPLAIPLFAGVLILMIKLRPLMSAVRPNRAPAPTRRE